MRCDATKRRYALQCKRTGVSWLVDGRPMCTEHAIRDSAKLDDDKVHRLFVRKGNITLIDTDKGNLMVLCDDGSWQLVKPLLSTEE